MPDGTIPYGCPASQIASHIAAPCSIGAYSSQPSSPTYEIRDASACTGPLSIERQRANGNAACDTAADGTDRGPSRARGPHNPSVHQAEVTSSSAADPSPGR